MYLLPQAQIKIAVFCGFSIQWPFFWKVFRPNFLIGFKIGMFFDV